MTESLIDKANIKITDDSFSKCWLDLKDIPAGSDAFKVFNKKLAAYEEFRNYDNKFGYIHLTNTMAIKFIVCMYDPFSPFAHIEDYHKRKLMSAEFAGFEASNTGTLTTYAQYFMQGKMPIANAMIIQYCILVHSIDYATYQILQRKYYEDTLMNPKATLTSIKQELEVLNDFRDEILAGDRAPGVQLEFYKTVSNAELEVRKFRPEYKAQEWVNQFNESHGIEKEKK
jgi:hypothetical protein